MLQDIKSYLGRCFAMKDLGEAAYILRIKIYRDRSKRLIGLCQSAYIEKILKRYYMESSKRGTISMQEKLKFSKSQGASTPAEIQRMQNIPYNPSDAHWTAVKNILKYLHNTNDMFLVYEGDTKRELRVSCYTDVGYLTDADDMKSQTGYVFILNGGVVDWKSTKQSIFATSSTDAEYIDAFDASKESVWIHKFISGLGVVPTIEEPMNMYCDNTGAIAIAKDHGVTKEWGPCRARVRTNRLFADSDTLSQASYGSVGPRPNCEGTTQAQKPGVPIIRHQVPPVYRYYTLDENSYPTFWDSDEGRIIALDPSATAVSGGNSDSINRLFDEGDNAGQEHSAERDDVQEEVIAKDASEVVVEKPQRKRKRKVIGDASGSALPPKSDATRPAVTASVTPTPDVETVDSVSGLNLRTRPPHVRYVVFSDSSLHSDSYSEAASLVRSVADAPVVTVVVTTTIDANVTAGSKAKYVLREIEHTGDSASAGRIEVDAVSISKLKKSSISPDSFYASQSLDTETLHRVYVPRWKLRAMDYDHLYSEFNVGVARQVCLGAEVRMRTEHTLEKKNELEDKCARQANLISERDTEIAHLKSLLSFKEAEATKAISLRGQLAALEVADASKIEALESTAASKEIKLTSLSSHVVKLTADLSGFQLSRDELNSKVASLESERDCLVTQRSSLEFAFEFFKGQVEKMQDEQVGVLIDRVAAIDSDLMEMALHMDAEFYPRYLTTIAGRRWLLNRGLKLVLSKCLSSPEYLSAMGEAIGRAIDKGMQDGLAAGIEHGVAGRSITDVAAYNPSAESDYVAAVNALQSVSFPLLAQLEAHKDASMADIMDLLRLESPTAKSSEARPPQPSLDELMIPIHRLEDQWLRGDATARRLSLTDSIRPLVEPLSSRVLTGEASSSADVTMTTVLATTFAQTFPISAGVSTEVPPSPKIIFAGSCPPMCASYQFMQCSSNFSENEINNNK
ncbi:hypothetical protein Tco_1229816 [Tanacetum coccineum]